MRLIYILLLIAALICNLMWKLEITIVLLWTAIVVISLYSLYNINNKKT